MGAVAKKRKNRMPSASLRSTALFSSDTGVGVFTSMASDATQLKTLDQLHAWLNEREPHQRGGLDIRGRVVAQLGIFKDRRGQFDEQSLNLIVKHGNKAKKGLKSNYKHKTLSSDGLGKFLGRDSGFSLDDSGEILKVRSSHFELSAVAMKPPPEGGGTPYGEYVAELAISDPQAFSSSLVLNYKSVQEVDDDGKPVRDNNDRLQPSIWRPTRLWSVDVVEIGDAVDDFLGFDELTENDDFVRLGNQLITQYFDMDEITPEALTARLHGFVEKVVDHHFEDDMGKETDKPEIDLSELSAKQDQTIEALGKTNTLLEKFLKGQLNAGSAGGDESGDSAGNGNEGSAPSFEDALKIQALCAAQGQEKEQPELLEKFKTGKLSMEGVKDFLLSKNADQRTLGDDNESDDQGGDLGKGGGKQLSLDERLKVEYEGNEEFARMGLSFEEYAEGRKIDLGKKPETSELMSESKSFFTAKSTKEVLDKMGGVGAAILACVAALGYLLFTGDFATSSIGFAVGMAVSANQLASFDGKARRAPRKVLAAKKLYDGTIAFIDATTGYLTDISDSGANKFGGIMEAEADNSNGASGALEVTTTVESQVVLQGVTHALVQADIEKPIYATDNHSIQIASASATLIGKLVGFDGKSNPIIFVN